jgi:hypothetical protein
MRHVLLSILSFSSQQYLAHSAFTSPVNLSDPTRFTTHHRPTLGHPQPPASSLNLQHQCLPILTTIVRHLQWAASPSSPRSPISQVLAEDDRLIGR